MASSVKRISPIEAAFAEEERRVLEQQAAELLGMLIRKDQYVGDVYSISYESALVQIHDFHRKQVGGIPGLCFLLATRLNPGDAIDYQEEDASVILLRVLDSAPLPNDREAERIRVEIAQRASGNPEYVHWDDPMYMDPKTNNHFGFAGVKCQVVGTFFLDQLRGSGKNTRLALHFGSDLSNYYPNRGLKVYKPKGDVLACIVNYRDPLRTDEWTNASVSVGEVRYASTNRSFQDISNVQVNLSPGDLLDQKTAVFGMTRTGKSNTTKIIIKSVFELRFKREKPLRIGQLVFDQNGEYANDNVQDANAQRNPSAIRNVWHIHADGKSEDVVTFGITPHPADPKRRLMLLNFFEERNLQIGKDMINEALASDSAKFIQNFRQVTFQAPDDSFKDGDYYRAKNRYDRYVLVYRALLAKAGFAAPRYIRPVIKGVITQKLIEAMREAGGSDAPTYKIAGDLLAREDITWLQLAQALEALYKFIGDNEGGYAQFDMKYMEEHSDEPWADATLLKLLEMFSRPNGAKQIGAVANRHTDQTTTDYADDIYDELTNAMCMFSKLLNDQTGGKEPARAD
jgi:hypothetical protein